MLNHNLKTSLQITLFSCTLLSIIGSACGKKDADHESPTSSVTAPAPTPPLSERYKELIKTLIEGKPEEHDSTLQEVGKLTDQEKKAASLWYVDSLVEKATPADPQLEQKYQSFLKSLGEILPEVSIVDHIVPLGFITPKGLKKVINKYEHSTSFAKELSEIEMIPVENFAATINQHLAQQTQGLKRFIVVHGLHFSGVFASFHSSTATLILMDSAGAKGSQYSQYTEDLKKAIYASQLKNASVYAISYPRQADAQSCPTTTLQDHLESMSVDLFSYVASESQNPKVVQLIETETSSGNKLYHLHKVPPHFMKTVQSESRIKGYIKADPNVLSIQVSSSGNLLETLAPYTYEVSENKKVNFYLRKKFFEYVQIIVHSLIEQ